MGKELLTPFFFKVDTTYPVKQGDPVIRKYTPIHNDSKELIKAIEKTLNRKILLVQSAQWFRAQTDLPWIDKIFGDNTNVAHWLLSELPGCCGVCVSNNVSIVYDLRGKGLGKLFNLVRQMLAYDLGWTLMICTDLLSNTPQQKILSTNNWKLATQFRNRKTDHIIGLHYINIPQALNIKPRLHQYEQHD